MGCSSPSTSGQNVGRFPISPHTPTELVSNKPPPRHSCEVSIPSLRKEVVGSRSNLGSNKSLELWICGCPFMYQKDICNESTVSVYIYMLRVDVKVNLKNSQKELDTDYWSKYTVLQNNTYDAISSHLIRVGYMWFSRQQWRASMEVQSWKGRTGGEDAQSIWNFPQNAA